MPASRPRTAAVCAAALCAALLAPVSVAAQAGEVWTTDDGGSSLELRGFYKLFGAAVSMQPGLVEGTEALQRLFDQARLAHPDLVLPQVRALPRNGASSAQTVRGWGRLLLKNRVEVSAGWQLDATLASDRALAGGAALGGTVPVAGTATASRRLVDVDRVLASGDRFVLQQNLDLLAVKVRLPRGEVAVGRQVLSWGTGRFWNPTDLLSPFAPTDVDREVHRGVDAVRFSMPLGKTSLLDVLYLPQKEGWAQGAVARAQANVGGVDVSLSVAKYVSDLVVGTDAAGEIGPLGVHGEFAYTASLPNIAGARRAVPSERFLRGVMGLEWRPAEAWVLGAEYYFNGVGAADPGKYAARLRSDRVARGEVFGAGRHYVGLTAGWQSSGLLAIQALVVSNVADPSALVVPVLEYSAGQNVIVRAGGYVPIGRGPDAGVFRTLTVSDLLQGTPAYLDAASSLGLRSEYGASPVGLFAQLGVYF